MDFEAPIFVAQAASPIAQAAMRSSSPFLLPERRPPSPYQQFFLQTLSPPFFVAHAASSIAREAILLLWTLSPPFLLPKWRPPSPEQQCVCCGLRHAYVCRRQETPCFFPGVSSPLFLFWTSSPPLSLCWILSGKSCASPFASVMHIVCRCHETPCFFPSVSSPLFLFLDGKSFSAIHLFPMNPNVPLCWEKSLLASYFG